MKYNKDKMNDEFVNIQPSTSVYSTYSRLSYTLWHAIAEFVDNSTASYFLNKEKLNKIKDYKLEINIIYYKNNNDSNLNFLRIIDNAYGMEKDDFKRAVQLNKPPVDKSGRNEFGMGLKTACCWFGKKWEIRSKQLGSQNEYFITMDIDKISKNSENQIKLITSSVEKNKHYTILTIRNLNRFIKTKRQRDNIKKQIASMYRCDLKKGNIKIRYIEAIFNNSTIVNFTDGDIKYENSNDIPSLKFNNPKIWKEENQELKFNFNHEIIFNEINYKLNGFIAIRDTASRTEAGFTLIRRGRVIESNYRPKDIFKDPGSFIYQRLFGEINMDNWPVMQAKNAFDWDNGLEDSFIDKLKEISEDYRIKANKLRKKVKSINASDVSSIDSIKINTEIENMLNIPNKIISKDNELNNIFNSAKVDDKYNFDNTISLKNNNQEGIKIEFEHSSEKNTKWISIITVDSENNKYKVIIYLEHSFFKPYTEKEEFLFLLKRFIAALTASIINIVCIKKIKEISPIRIIDVMNYYLSENVDKIIVNEDLSKNEV